MRIARFINPNRLPRRQQSNSAGLWTQARRLCYALHHDENGTIGVLLLLTVWALASMIGLVWNSGEYATKKRQTQAAADSAAQAGQLWVSRTTNITSATNMVISENGSAEVILRSVEPTSQTIQNRFNSEKQRATQLQQGDTIYQPEKNYPDCEYFEELLGFGGFAGNGRGDKRLNDLNTLTPPIQQAVKLVLPLLPAPQQQQVLNDVIDHLRRNGIAMTWLNNVWVGGQNPPAAAAGGGSQPSAPGGGLRGTVSPWITNEVRPRLADILSTLGTEQSDLDSWNSQTAPATSGTTPDELQQKRSDIFSYQQQILSMTPQVVDDQRSALSTFYKCDLTYATPGNPSDPGQPAQVQPPLQPASDVQGQSHSDGIREEYPEQAEARFGTSDPTVQVDAINVNVDNAVIWHPGEPEQAPPLTLKGQTFQGTFQVGGGEWGHVPCAPLSRYFNDRVSRDEQGLRKEPQEIDQARSDMRGRIYPPPSPPSLPTLPRSIPDSLPKKPAIPIAPEAIGQIPSPQGLTAAAKSAVASLNTQIAQYNSDMRKYVSDLNGLPSELQAMYNNLYNLCDTATQTFADQTWLNNVEANRALVLREMGDAKEFLVLKTYALAQIPEWAQSEMHDSVYQYVYQQIISQNQSSLTNQLRSQLKSWAQGVLGNAKNARQQAQQFANQNAGPAAQQMAQEAAAQIAEEVATEWVARPWPFEITPPQQPVPPVVGITDDDRHKYFTILAGAKTNDQSAPKPVMTQTFGSAQTPMVAFAQGENFNWMEFNGSYGAGDSYTTISNYGHGDMGGSPRPWRISTTGGWNWQPRLALSDALFQAMQDGADFQSYMNAGGVTGNDQDAINTLTLH